MPDAPSSGIVVMRWIVADSGVTVAATEVTDPRCVDLYFEGFDGTGNYPVMKFIDDVGNIVLMVRVADSGIATSAPFDIPYITETGELVASELVADPGSEYIQVKKNLRLGTVSIGPRSVIWYTGMNGGEVEIVPPGPDDANAKQYTLPQTMPVNLGEVAGITARTSTSATIDWITADACLAKGVSVDLNSTTKQTLFTVPTGKDCIITKVVERNASAAVTTAVGSFGFNAGASDVIASFNVYDDLTGTGVYTIKEPGRASTKGASTNTFGYKGSVAEGAARTMVVDVFGYLL